MKVFGKTNIQFGYVDYDSAYTTIIVHLEWNLIFFVGAERTIIAYDMDQKKFKSSLLVSTVAMVDVKSWHGS